LGLGSVIISRISAAASDSGMTLVNIEASQKSAPFFAKFAALKIAAINNDYEPGMYPIVLALSLYSLIDDGFF